MFFFYFATLNKVTLIENTTISTKILLDDIHIILNISPNYIYIAIFVDKSKIY